MNRAHLEHIQNIFRTYSERIQNVFRAHSERILAVIEPCDNAFFQFTDVRKLPDAELATRKKFSYAGQTPEKDKFCSNCLHWCGSSGQSPCGTCEPVNGPINPMGTAPGGWQSLRRSVNYSTDILTVPELFTFIDNKLLSGSIE